ncbi:MULTISPECIES: hypothetical protein [unclassified Micromonospora]|uniref:hypothetical protein n=1 Tax=unclassified Micromonospora TaxID=2617518 RepID=UPI002FF3A46A
MTEHDEGRADEEPPGPDVPSPEAEAGAARRGPAWLIVGVVAGALLVCCCSAVLGLALSWSAGLFGPR